MTGAILSLIILALTLSLLVTPLVRKVALRLGLVDLPGGRKVHAKPIPRIGGIAVFVAYFGSFLIAFAILRETPLTGSLAALKPFAPAAILVFFAGLVDDVFGLKPWHKLAVEVVAGLLVVSSGLTIPVIASLPLSPVVAAICTIVWLVVCVNAVNLIDGLDGLASGIALMTTATILAVSLSHGATAVAIVVAPLLGALLGFLVFNFNPASIFLGDSGSLVIGFLLACFGIVWGRTAQTSSGMAVPMIALALPLVDTSLAIVRRFLRSQPIFSADRSHIHHRLLARGFTQRRVVLILYAVTAVAGILALGLVSIHQRWTPFLVAALVGGIWLGIRRLGYAELEAARRVLTGSAFRREVTAQLAVRKFEENLAGAKTANDCWKAILESSREFGFEPTRMQLGGQAFAHPAARASASCWDLHLPITQSDWIELAHEPGAAGYSNAAINFIEVIGKLRNRERTVFPAESSYSRPSAVWQKVRARGV